MDSSKLHVVILGCGYTGLRVAKRFLERAAGVTVTSRDAASLETIERQGANVIQFDAADPQPIAIPPESLVLHSIPLIETAAGPGDATREVLASLTHEPRRVVYLSTTGVYGATRDVNESTPPAPRTAREILRMAAETAVCEGPWESLILRPAAIYGPSRGIHVSMQRGLFQLSWRGENFVSRIHVEDLANHAEAALLSDLTGAYPVGDELPCTSREIAEYCSRLLGVLMPEEVAPESLHATRRADRRVDGRCIRASLGIRLRYPTYREGIPASL